MSAPTFIFFGGQRCASTWAQRCLSEHPEVFITDHEVHFFDWNYDKGVSWYYSHFTPGPEHKVWGEKTPRYLSEPEVAERIRSLLPDVRLVCCLRDPVERAYSAYQLRRYEDGLGTFEEALEDEPNLLGMGMYAEHLRRWFNLFPRDQILVLLYDDLARDEASFVRAIYTHIGVNPDFRPTWLGKKANAVIFPRLRRALGRVGMEPVIRAASGSPVGNVVRRWNHRRRTRAYTPMDEQTRTRLYDHYRSPNEELEQLLGVDLSEWQEQPSAGG